ncbi:MAG TPA: cell division ATP-binding protein FtsE [Anaeromyxobacteraceae bacterium]|nr:cell division ATP-binding protein FtsE [Anaeromyxobacteraceae bacterium]
MIQLYHVTKQYAGEAPALRDVTLRVEKGEFVFVTGPSGAGKSTLIRLIFCAEAATSGQLLVFGRNLAKVRPSQVPYLRRAIGVVFQDFKLLPDRTVAENVAFPLEVRGLFPKDVRRKVQGMLRSVGLELKAGKFPLSLSGGEQQRVAVARALVGDPALLLADEPTGNLDPERTLEVMELLQAANARGTTVVVATHDRQLLERYKRRILALERGQLVSDGAQVRQAGTA